MTVFEDEWLFDPDSAKSKISKVLNVSKHVKAEDCDIVVEGQKISIVERQTNSNLMSVLFSHSRLNIKEEWEIADMHEALFITVEGGLERIISEFEKQFHPKSVTVFVDRRWSNGSEYEACGFKTVKKLKPQCWWFDIHDIHRHHEREFVEKIANEILNEKFTHSRKQMDKLKQLGWMRIYDCGKLKMVKTFSA